MILFYSLHIIKNELLGTFLGTCITKVADRDSVRADCIDYLAIAGMRKCI